MSPLKFLSKPVIHHLWGGLYLHVSPQALHFFIGLGALVSPLVADPFLAEDSCVLGANLTANSSSSSSADLQHLRSSLAGHGAALHNISRYPLHTEGTVITRVSYAFWIMAFINVGSCQHSVSFEDTWYTVPVNGLDTLSHSSKWESVSKL